MAKVLQHSKAVKKLIFALIAISCISSPAFPNTKELLDAHRLEKVRECKAIPNDELRVSCVLNLSPEVLKMSVGEHAPLRFQHKGNLRVCAKNKAQQAVCAADKTLAGLEDIFGRRVLDPHEKLELVQKCIDTSSDKAWKCLYNNIYKREDFFIASQKDNFDRVYRSELNWCSRGKVSAHDPAPEVKILKRWADCAANRGLKRLKLVFDVESPLHDSKGFADLNDLPSIR